MQTMSGWISDNYKSGLVTVIIPTYNRAGFLEEALQSVLTQTYRPIECIVVDDGSTDHTSAVLDEYARLQDDVFTLVVIRQKNSGAPAARNIGTTESKGEFIQYLDSDDLLYPSKIAEQVYFLKENQNCDCVFGDWEKGSINQKELVNAYKSDNLFQQFLTLERPIVNFSMLLRKTLVKQAGLWDVSLKRMQEIDFQLKAVAAGGQFFYQPVLCGLWRHHDNERIHNQTTVKDMLPFFQKWEQILVDQQLFSNEMGRRIAGWYLWFVSQSKDLDMSVLLPVLKEVVRLQPSIPFYCTKKMKLLRWLFGRRKALYIWLIRYRFT